VVAAAVVIPTAAAAAAVVHFRAETGQYGKPGYTENDTSEYIDMCASDIRRYVATLEPTGRPLPPGVTWDQVAARYVDDEDQCPPFGPGVEEQVTGIRTGLIYSSTCYWQRWALSAPRASAAADLEEADAAIADDFVAVHAISPKVDSGWKQEHDEFLHASRAFVDWDYQVNCLGRNTASNPPTVTEPPR
jgi:hypothetical protein